MKYKVVVFGVKDTSENIVEFIHKTICPVDLVLPSVRSNEENQVSGYKGLSIRQRNSVFRYMKRTAIF